jgi:AAA domain
MNYSEYLAWDDQLEKLKELAQINDAAIAKITSKNPVVILRDWQGFLHLCLPCEPSTASALDLREFIHGFHNVLGGAAWKSMQNEVEEPNAGDLSGLAVFRFDEVDGADIWLSPDLVKITSRLSLLDRQGKDQEWLRRDLAPNTNSAKRVVFYGVKGGVGRSTAISGLALQLGELGKSVLVVDLDLESPGVSSSLLGTDLLPDFGVVDWLTANAMGVQTKEMEEGLMVESSPLSRLTQAKIHVAPSFGSHTQSYVRKLGRVFRANSLGEPYSVRIDRLISSLEKQYKSDVTLIDCRAGIDDTSAVALTHLNADLVLLFAINTEQTWKAYQILFKHLMDHPSVHTASDFRYKLQLISALTPDVAVAPSYYENMCGRAYDLMECLYDQVEPPSAQDAEEDAAAFYFSGEEKRAPHIPWRIMWDEALRAFDAVSHHEHLSMNLRQKIFGEFTGEIMHTLFEN